MVLQMAANEDPHFVGIVQRELNAMKRVGDAMIVHDTLAEPNESFYFVQFAAHAEQHGLRYVGDAELEEMHLNDKLGEFLRNAPNPIEREQYLDFFSYRRFRRSLLCRDDMKLHSAPQFDADAFDYASQAEPQGEHDQNGAQQFKAPETGMMITLDDPIALAALRTIRAAWPRSLSFAELGAELETGQATSLHSALWQLACSALINLRLEPMTVAPTISERPLASALARHQALEHDYVSTLTHESVRLSPELRELLPLLDGLRDRAALEAELSWSAEALACELQHAWKLGLLWS